MKTLVRRGLLLLSVLVIALPGLSAVAQGLTAEELELVELVQRSYESLQDLQSYHVEGSANAFQTVSADFQGGVEVEVSMDVDFGFDVVPNGAQNIDDMDGTSHMVLSITQSTGESQFMDFVMDTVLVEGLDLSRIVESETDLGVPLNEWTPSVSGQTAPPIPVDRENSEPFLLLYLVNPQTVIAVEERESTTVNGEDVRVILLDLDPALLRDQRVIYELGFGPENDTNFTASLDGVGALTLDTRYAMLAYIGEDGLPRAVEYLFSNYVTGELYNGLADQQLTGTVVYSGYDAPVTIENPLAGPGGTVGTELENLVTDAYTNLQSLDSYRVEGRTIGGETVSSERSGLDIDMSIVYAYDVVPNGRADPDDMTGTTNLVMNMVQGAETQHMAILLDNVLLDGTLYTLIQEADVAGGLSVPVGEWYESGVGGNAIIPEDRANSEPFLFYYLADPLSIKSLTELSSQTLGGQPMRVFEVALDPVFLRELGVITATGIGEGTSFNLTASFDGMGQLTTETTYVMTIFIGEDDNLPHCIEYRFDQLVTTELRSGRADQSIEGVLEYSNFDETVTVGNPLEGDGAVGSTGGEPLDYPESCTGP